MSTTRIVAGPTTTAMHPGSRVYIAGHRGLVGSALTRHLTQAGYNDLLLRTHAELDLTRREAVWNFFSQGRPEFVVLAAARVGGIHANSTYPVDFISENLLIQSNVIDACYEFGVQRLLFLGSSCIYPKLCPQPIREEYLLTGPLEPTNRPYAVAKIAGIEQCWAYNRQHGTKFVAAMPTNLYGPEDNFDLQNSHVLPALLHKVAIAKAADRKAVQVWGSGTPRREFLYSDDLAEACVFLLELGEEQFDKLMPPDEPPLINIGVGEDVTIRELAELICRIAGYRGALEFDTTKPDGTPRKLLDASRLRALGWTPKIGLEEGIRRTFAAAKRALTGAAD
ncbi:MAG: GDP-L-fucose synthase family protein [Acidobacteriaceae bacterium]